MVISPAPPMSSLAKQCDTTGIQLSDIADGSGGLVIHGETEYDDSGYSVSSAGDINGDGLADLIISGHQAALHVAGDGSGRSYVVCWQN